MKNLPNLMRALGRKIEVVESLEAWQKRSQLSREGESGSLDSGLLVTSR